MPPCPRAARPTTSERDKATQIGGFSSWSHGDLGLSDEARSVTAPARVLALLGVAALGLAGFLLLGASEGDEPVPAIRLATTGSSDAPATATTRPSTTAAPAPPTTAPAPPTTAPPPPPPPPTTAAPAPAPTAPRPTTPPPDDDDDGGADGDDEGTGDDGAGGED